MNSKWIWLLFSFVFFHFNAQDAQGALRKIKFPKSKRLIVHYQKKDLKVRSVVQNFQKESHLNAAMAIQTWDQEVVGQEEDLIMLPMWEPGDSGTTRDALWNSQWHYHQNFASIDLPSAWDITKGNNIVVAVVDTGILPHQDLNGRVLPGADFVSDPSMSNDGDGRDMNPTDPGDWIGAGDPCFNGQSYPSSWHGTHVAGTIGANVGNGVGVAGINGNARILPIRVLGKCGGYTSDIVDGMKWAAGISIPGMPNNANPAKIINLSLGAPGACGAYMQNAINEIRSRGTIVVVAAGNSQTNINYQQFSPANCQGVLTVGATSSVGDISSYSNYGSRVDVSAPGGESWKGVWSLSDYGYSAQSGATYKSMAGTSMASPHVAGIISLMLSVKSGLVPSQIINIIKDTSSSFAPGSFCKGGGTCGQGIANAYDAVRVASTTNTNGVSDDYHPTPVQYNNGPSQYQISNKDSGGCGSMSLVDGQGPKGPGGPGNWLGAFLLGVVLSLLAAKTPKLQTKKASKK